MWPVGVTLASAEIFRAARRYAPTPHPRVTASPLSLEERPLCRVSKDGPWASHGSRRRFTAHHEGPRIIPPRFATPSPSRGVDRARVVVQTTLDGEGAGNAGCAVRTRSLACKGRKHTS